MERLRYKELDKSFMCHLNRSIEPDRQMEETRLGDVSVGQNVLKINA